MNKQIKVFHLITDLNVGGAETMLYRLLSRMDRDTFRPQVVSMTSLGKIGEEIAALGIPVRALSMRPGQPNPSALMRLVRWLRKDPPDLLQTWMYHADLMGLVVAGLAGRIPVVWNLRASDMDMSRYRRLSSWTVKACAWLSPLPRAIIVNSEAGLRHHTRMGYRPRQWAVIPNGVDTGHFKPDVRAANSVREELGLRPDTPLIGLIARYDPMKDHETFFLAAQQALSSESGVHFLLCGSGVDLDNPAITAWMGSIRESHQFHLLGERRDIAKLTAALDIASSSSKYGEGFSNTIAEAMACGVPCVVTDVGDSALIVGDTGRVVPPADPRALAEACIELIRMDPPARAELGAAARRRIQEHFSLEAMVARYRSLYEEVLAHGGQ